MVLAGCKGRLRAESPRRRRRGETEEQPKARCLARGLWHGGWREGGVRWAGQRRCAWHVSTRGTHSRSAALRAASAVAAAASHGGGASDAAPASWVSPAAAATGGVEDGVEDGAGAASSADSGGGTGGGAAAAAAAVAVAVAVAVALAVAGAAAAVAATGAAAAFRGDEEEAGLANVPYRAFDIRDALIQPRC